MVIEFFIHDPDILESEVALFDTTLEYYSRIKLNNDINNEKVNK